MWVELWLGSLIDAGCLSWFIAPKREEDSEEAGDLMK